MSNPHSLRLCCLATMAPALTSEAASRARDKLTGSPASPSVPLMMNGRDLQMNSANKGRPPPTHGHFMATTKANQVIGISKDLQKSLADVENSKVPPELGRGQTVNLRAITGLSDLYQQSDALGSSSPIRSAHLDNFICTSVSLVPSSISQPLRSRNLVNVTSQSNGTIMTTRTASPGPALAAGTCPRVCGASSFVQQHQDISKNTSALKSSCTSVCKDVSASSSLDQQLKMGVSNGFKGLTSMATRTALSVTSASAGFSQLRTLATTRSNTEVQSTSQLLDSVERRQKKLEMRADRLMCRLRRLQVRQAIAHTQQQLGGFVEQQHRVMPTCTRTAPIDLQTELLHSKSMSTAALVELVHKMQSTQASLHQRLAASSHGSEGPTRLGEERCAELERVSGHLISNLSHLQSALDSDATESSSGGESCDELEYEDDWDGKVPRPPIQCRAEWQWASERAAIASRWTWLQAQVSDLEYRIRQQYEIFKQIKLNKGGIILGDVSTPEDALAKSRKELLPHRPSPLEEKIASLQAKNEVSPSNVSSVVNSTQKQLDNLKTQTTTLSTPPSSVMSTSSNGSMPTQKMPSTLNGFIDGTSVQGPDESGSRSDDTFQAARCRPVKSYRKRRLLSTSGLHQQNRKAARLSTVSCRCFPPMMACAMCGGRYNNTMRVDPLTMPLMERVALLDMSFHPVLSFPEDISLLTHFESMLKTGAWQQKPPPKAYKVLQPDRKRLKLKSGVRIYQRKLKKNTSAAILSSTKIRNKYEQKQLGRNLVNSPVKSSSGSDKKLIRSEVRLRKQKMLESLQHMNRVSRSGGELHSGDLSASVGSQSQIWKELKEGMRKKRGESAYDINNIVIPYSIAASTRVERLQYKEILTPKWREVNGSTGDEESSNVKVPSMAPNVPVSLPQLTPEPDVEKTKQSTSVTELDDSEVEDLSDEVFRQRHLRCEISEKQRFAMALPSKSHRRNRNSQRTENNNMSYTELNSPDNIHQQDTVTPPGTPGASSTAPEDSDELTRRPLAQDYSRRRSSSVSSAKSSRSRSTSHSEERRLICEDDRPSIAPWTKRTFPLTDEEYEMLTASPTLKTSNSSTQLRDSFSSARVITEEMAVTIQNLPTSPMHANNSDTSSDIVEDPADPEWTVVMERSQQQAKQPHLVLKLAKR